MKRFYFLMTLLLSSTISFSQTNLLSLAEGTTPLGYLGQGLSITGGWNQTPNVLALTYHGRDFAIGGWSKSNTSWMGASLFINSDNGNVGIGTTEPTNTLTLRRTALGTSNDVGIDFSATNGAYNPVYARIALGVGTALQDQGTGYLSFSTLNSGTLIESMRINPTGNVGIGTNDPKGYKLAVNGKIRAQEIKVEASPWPDYVFKKDYPLPSLQQTENHIKEKGHLPGIPSAAEVKANGIDLGEMNAKLLLKIEELTLHLIKENKINIETQKRLEEQDNKIKILTELVLGAK